MAFLSTLSLLSLTILSIMYDSLLPLNLYIPNYTNNEYGQKKPYLSINCSMVVCKRYLYHYLFYLLFFN